MSLNFQFTQLFPAFGQDLHAQGMRFVYPLIIWLFCSIPLSASAQVVISEVMWPGSDRSTSDEWLEIANASDTVVDLSGWSLWYLKTTGAEGSMVTFPAGTTIHPGQYFLVSSKHEADSRLAREPDLYASALSLPNTKLLLKLKNASGAVVDQADDGVGSPFAGANPSGTGAKASMERIDLRLPGILETNWRTATTSAGFDVGTTIFGTPGFPNSFSASSSSSSSSIVFSSASSDSSVSSVSSSSSASSTSSCFDPLAIRINVQSGELRAAGHTTLNVEAAASTGSLAGLTCRWSATDGFSSDSCNPGPHSFSTPGITILSLAVVNHCGNTLTQVLSVEVIPSGSSSSASMVSSVVPYDGSRIVIMGVLPNPPGADSAKEWIEIKNVEDHAVSLSGFELVLGETSTKHFPLSGLLDAGETRRIFNSELSFSLKNTEQILRLMAPNADVLSTVSWDSPEEGRVSRPSEIRSITVRGLVTHVVDGDTFDLALDSDARRVLGEEVVRVRLLGVNAMELFTDSGEPEPFATDAYEFLKALTEGKKVELEFDTDLWDKYGRLLAYAYLDGGLLLEDQLLVNGLVEAMDAFDYRRKDFFHDLEDRARILKIGLWSIDREEALNAQKKSTYEQSFRSSLPSSSGGGISGVYISEIFPSPDPKKAADNPQGEWMELGLDGHGPLSLSGWTLSAGKRSRILDSRISFGSGGLILVPFGVLKLQLPNAGALVELRAPDGATVASVTYPAIPIGQSYAFDSSDASYCITSTPTPLARNRCAGPASKPRTSTAGRRTAGYAAAYREQLNGAESTITLSHASESPVSAAWLLFMTLPGAVLGVLGTVVGVKMGWVRVEQ